MYLSFFLAWFVFGRPTVEPAYAVQPGCLVKFATASALAEERDALIRDTYGRLIEEVGKGKINAETLRQMSEDPFRAPEADGLDLAALNRHLREFRTLLEEKGWNGEGTRALLLAELNRRLGSLSEAALRRDQAVANLQGDYIMPFAASRKRHFTADGRYVVVQRTSHLPGHPNEGSLSIFDTKARTYRTVPRPKNLGADPLFLPGRTDAIFPMKRQSFVAVPFVDGEFKFDEAKELLKGNGKRDESLRYLQPTAQPGVFWGPMKNEHSGIARVDFNTGQIEYRVLPEEFRKRHHQGGPIPGQNRFYFSAQEGDFIRVGTALYDADGNLRFEHFDRRVDKHAGAIRFSADGHLMIATGEERRKRVEVGPAATSEPLTAVTSSNGNTEFPGKIRRVFPLPGKDQLLVVCENQEDQTKTRLELVDLTSRRTLRAVDVPVFIDEPVLSPDGTTLLVYAEGGHARALNLAPRLFD